MKLEWFIGLLAIFVLISGCMGTGSDVQENQIETQSEEIPSTPVPPEEEIESTPEQPEEVEEIPSTPQPDEMENTSMPTVTATSTVTP